jgi:hypothetical protein
VHLKHILYSNPPADPLDVLRDSMEVGEDDHLWLLLVLLLSLLWLCSSVSVQLPAYHNLGVTIAICLAQILSPLVGKKQSYVKNSSAFAQKIKEAGIQDGEMMVSFDV